MCSSSAGGVFIGGEGSEIVSNLLGQGIVGGGPGVDYVDILSAFENPSNTPNPEAGGTFYGEEEVDQVGLFLPRGTFFQDGPCPLGSNPTTTTTSTMPTTSTTVATTTTTTVATTTTTTAPATTTTAPTTTTTTTAPTTTTTVVDPQGELCGSRSHDRRHRWQRHDQRHPRRRRRPRRRWQRPHLRRRRR